MLRNLSIEVLLGMTRMPVEECQELAQIVAFDTMEFDLVCPEERRRVKWTNAHKGTYIVRGEKEERQADEKLKACWCEDIHGIGDMTP